MPAMAKRSDQRRRRNARPLSEGAAGVRPVPPDPPEWWNERAKGWLLGLRDSGQSDFYEASDWQMALVAGDLLTKFGETGRANLIEQFLKIATVLLASEGDRRRAYLELRRDLEAEVPQEKASDRARRVLGVVADAG